MTAPSEPSSSAHKGSFGPNAWLVDDMYDRFLLDPDSVSPSWREFFADYQRSTVPTVTTSVLAAPAAPAAPAPAKVASGEGAVALRGASARIVTNMVASLGVPTATSVRTVAARLLEINRTALNENLARSSGAKVSFTHFIAYAVVKGLGAVPSMNSTFVEAVDAKGTPGVVHHEHVGLGLAVDVERADGTRNLLVPVIRDADTLDFRGFLLAYEDLVRKVHAGTFGADDFVGATVSLTNPGTLGTVQSVPRLMPGQGAIIGVGALAWPAGFEAADPRTLAEIGVGKVMSLTSTYDHRIIQGAESGLFLKYVAECLTGGHAFYEEIFSSLGVPYEPAHWANDRNPGHEDNDERTLKHIRVQELINMYRVRGHLYAHLDPLHADPPPLHPELEIDSYGLTIWDLQRSFVVAGLAGKREATLAEILSILRDAYCRTIGIEYGHIMDPAQKRWIQERVEGVRVTTTRDQQHRILRALNEAEVFERFLHSRYVGQKRFGLEGGESTIVALHTILDAAAEEGLSEAVIGMAHRGRLNVLANVVGKSYSDIFSEFEGNLDPESVQGSGDVKYHKGARGAYVSSSGAEIAVSMASNPSHLEAVSPVVEGVVRAKQDLVLTPDDGSSSAMPSGRFPYLPILIHGDAAFAGQGVVAETLNLSQLSGYRVGGAIHIVINNQVGFTTAPDSARSSFYPTDVAKMIQAPIFHVNGDDPEACARAAQLAFDYRETFRRDVVLDIVCYRRHGHNEGDDPSYTQPLMYKIIDQMRSVRKIYTETLVRRGDISLEEAEAALDAFNARLQSVLDEVRTVPVPTLSGVPVAEVPADVAAPATGVARDVLLDVARATMSAPAGFVIHPKLERQFTQRANALEAGEVDWALGEALAFGTLVMEGTNVRLMGQDSRRGTFSHRHAALFDYDNGSTFVPLSHLEGATGFFTVRDSLLSEYAALGFEYGYSVEATNTLVAWEAQFGDFVNGGEIIIDNFLVAAEDKWGQQSSLVMLLPHGYEGQGPEHSSGRLERFLSLCARNNLRVAQPTSAAQYFHLLRSQVRREHVTPLIVFTPKSMLRAAAVRSPLADFESGRFERVLDDPAVERAAVTRVVLATGKIAHEAILRRDEVGAHHVAIVRVEQIYPWPHDDLDAVFASYPALEEVVWLQEEPTNMGAWPFVHHQVHAQLRDMTVRHVARAESASPATGSSLVHAAEQADLLARAIL
ncbi:MAG TPA: multifunctional oxoglutarate decarboxylase/oxoglutarate dehydrogenase thiamine pyrophosphate-binding subunit/dihydrolipoyllysine-residue succinyltransferase subunit [Acidimicrobiales bacterium]|nr:multifunctional oxoglutarate decarboxylase/oxoglutarate dehydrogenase thiamine pyrophosphate-binding subunit/dihydrolipoyllysine-residue succinyltransferase subunit [Acidimicrobiales bacterium]